MSALTRLLALAALLSGILAAGLGAPAVAAPAEPAAPAIGVIDTQRMGKDANPIKKAWEQVNGLRDRLTGNLEQLKDSLFLTKPEFDEFVAMMDARLKGDLTAQQTARLNELKGNSLKGEKEWGTLAQKADATPEEKKRLEEMDKQRLQRLEFAKTLKDNYEGQLSKKAQEILEPVAALVDNTIAGVAKDQKLTIVLSKKVPTAVGQDEELVLWGGSDITDEVIKRLNKAK